MIALTRLSGLEFILNADMIESVEASPETVITLVDGKRVVVRESLDEIARAVQEYRARIISMSTDSAVEPAAATRKGHRPNLAPVSSIREEG